jgi:hypothetical protein
MRARLLLFRLSSPIDGDPGERGRPARRVWRPAKHIPAPVLNGRKRVASQPSEEKPMKGNQARSGARDAPRRDRDGRAPHALRLFAWIH